ncbi:zinc ribbon domain-containing protein [Nonomuraea sp. NPDC005650]|uniref:zinc ribbon domain-containing protein n=1 Tax=Nonomuraea sp. NPDC005650 TaxID=3157045 RepID=UPI0033B3A84D
MRGLARGRLSKAVREVSWGAFARLLEGKAARYGRTLVKIGRFFPSSQLCPCCGWKSGKLALEVREWDCPSCGEHHDRDIAAAINILTEGVRNIGISGSTVAAGLAGHGINDCGGQVRPGEATPTLAPPATYNAQAA